MVNESGPTTRQVTVCVVGGGPAGVMAGLLLARQGVEVLVLEKHADFLRDFRGDTIHPSTLTLLDELGWLDEFLALPHDRMDRIRITVAGHTATMADLTRLPGRCRFIALVPQWEFLNFLADKARGYAGFTLWRRAEVTDLLRSDSQGDGDFGAVTGVCGVREGEPFEVTADLVIGADGRHSTVRAAAGLRPIGGPPPMDVLWFRVPRPEGEVMPLFTAGRGALIMLPRNDFWQVALVGRHGMASRLEERGADGFRARVTRLRPELTGRVAALGWDDLHELQVRIDHLRRWHRPGLLCIGDAAHAMSPAGGVGINLAIQDAVATAHLLGPILRRRSPSVRELDAVRRRRLWPARLTQLVQGRIAVVIQNDRERDRVPLGLRVLDRVPLLADLVGRFVGLGVRPEHLGHGARGH